jgi:hypothetical protein
MLLSALHWPHIEELIVRIFVKINLKAIKNCCSKQGSKWDVHFPNWLIYIYHTFAITDGGAKID